MTVMTGINLKIVAYLEAKAAIHAIRCTVFQIEQGVDPAIESDGLDETAIHILAFLDEKPIGTARIRYLSDRLAKIERVAVLSAYRKKGVGRLIMKKAISFLKTKVSVIKINAQTHAKCFYEKLGFEQYGEEFNEAGIPHIEMRLDNTPHFGR